LHANIQTLRRRRLWQQSDLILFNLVFNAAGAEPIQANYLNIQAVHSDKLMGDPMQVDCGELNRQIAGRFLLIDLDGTLVDSSGSVSRAWTAWGEKHSVNTDEIFAISEGRQGHAVIAELRPDLDAHAEDAWLIDYQIRDLEGVVEVPGAAQFLQSLPRGQWAIVTSCTRELAVARLKAASLPFPEILVSANDVTASKPAPDGFLLAMQHLSVDPSRCIAFEDSVAGLEAARCAEVTTVAITHASRHPQRLPGLQAPNWLNMQWSNNT